MNLAAKSTSLFLILLVLGCSSSKELSTSTSDTSSNTEEVSDASKELPLTPSKDWHLLSTAKNPYYGVGVEKAYEDLLKDKTPGREVVVAIIDSGTDIEHEDLSGNVWVNVDEIAGNGIDDDNNGYIDDVHGWNFIGGTDGKHVKDDTYELTRIYAGLNAKYEDVEAEDVGAEDQEEFEYFQEIKAAYNEEFIDVQENLNQLTQIEQAVNASKQLLGESNMDSLSTKDLEPSSLDGPYLRQAKQLMTALKDNGVKEGDLEEALEQYQSLANYGLNLDFDPRHIVGDDYEDLTNRFYGNSDVSAIRNEHGTHVAGIVGAVRNNDLGMDGIVNVKLMIVRTTPNGDERDKDVANGIRYAAENGADVINMSFGKGYSPQKEYVDDAVRFADSLGVLLIHGAGNDNNDIDTTESFPNKFYKGGGMATNFMTVGATSWTPGEEIVAVFSNYGQNNVDIFAPGVAIYSTYPDNEYKENDGTSMAAPVVAGVAALVMAYYPELDATQVKKILMESVTIPSTTDVVRPGSEELVPFSTLSVSGGIVNAYEALKLAEKTVNGN
ncbi:MAG: S8 family serine peptidase [Balneolaceae bacterium]